MKKMYFLLILGISFLVVNHISTAQTTYTVNSTGDLSDNDIGDGICDAGDGECTLRAAIQEADSDEEADVIQFNLEGTGPHTISPGSFLPNITNPLTIDGTSEPDYIDIPVVEVSGVSAGETAAFQILSHDCSIKGLIINQFDGAGIVIENGSNNVIELNFIGTDETGSTDEGNAESGINVGGVNSTGNIIRDNVISGNDIKGVVLWQESSNTTITGNYIGTTRDGTAMLGNTSGGVEVNESTGNIIGGDDASERNIISGNGGDGIFITGMVFDLTIQGNYIGTDVSGSSGLPNSNGITGGSVETGLLIGGSSDGLGNVISGNTNDGIHLSGKSTIQGNYVGVTANGSVDLGNGTHGIKINKGDGHVIVDNVVSGNSGSGIYLMNATVNTSIRGNHLGLNAAGTSVIANDQNGLAIEASSNNIVGGTTADDRNLMSGNSTSGVFISGGSVGNSVLGNYMDCDVTGMMAIPNTNHGLAIENSTNNTIGGTTSGSANLISGGGGIFVSGSSSSGNVFQGNWVGLDATGLAAIDSGTETNNGISFESVTMQNTVGGSSEAARNVISGFTGNGVWLLNTDNTLVRGNYIGSDKNGAAVIGNGEHGIKIDNGSGNKIGGTGIGEGNLVVGSVAHGVGIVGEGAQNNPVLSNSIFSSGNLGIDLGSDNVTANDMGDSDNGPNNLQNSPVIDLELVYSDSEVDLFYMVDSNPVNALYPLTIQFFLSNSGEGQTLVATDTYEEADFTNGGKMLNLGSIADLDFEIDDLLTATATDAEGNTSEFAVPSVVTSITEDLTSAIDFRTYPNPFVNQINVDYTLSEGGFVDLSMIDLNGRRVQEMVSEDQFAGDHSIAYFNPVIEHQGVYLIVLKIDGAVISRERVIKQN